MKKHVLCALTLLAGASAVYSQGTVSMANYLVFNTYIYVSYKAANGVTSILGGSSAGPAATLSNYGSEIQNGNDWTVALYGAPGQNDAAGSLEPLGVTANVADGTIDPIVGTWWSTAVATIPGTGYAGSFATVQVYAWYNAGGQITSLDQAIAAGVPTGMSAAANVQVGGPEANGPPIVPTTLPSSALGNIIVGANSVVNPVPEGSTLMLFATGLAPFAQQLARRMRKKP